MHLIKTRIVLHFPGFEPLGARLHRERFARAAAQASENWNIGIAVDALQGRDGAGEFAVAATGANWATETHIHVFDLAEHIEHLLNRPMLTVLANGYAAFFKVIAFGGMWKYFRHAWRFALFAIFPFLLMGLGIIAAAALAVAPLYWGGQEWQFVAALLLSLAFFKFGLVPLANRFHTLLLFCDWQCAVDFATLKDQQLNARMAQMLDSAREALLTPVDEYLIVSHSIGGHAAAHIIGQIAEEEPHLLEGKNIVFASLGSGILQGALLRPARVLRRRVCAIAQHANIFWLDVQCLTDVSNFYKAKVARICGYTGERQPSILMIRPKTMLSKERYNRIKRDFLRVHRQYVLGNDVRARYDFALMCAGPLPASAFAQFSGHAMPPISQDGSIQET
jgi:hypothetical protein